MRIGGSLFLIALGAILKWAVTDHVHGVNLSVIGVILMVVGLVGLILSIAMMSMRRRTDVIHQNSGAYVDGVPQGVSRTTYKEPTGY